MESLWKTKQLKDVDVHVLEKLCMSLSPQAELGVVDVTAALKMLSVSIKTKQLTFELAS